MKGDAEIATRIDRKFYDLSKEERTKLVREMEQEIKEDLAGGNSGNIRIYAAYDDTYIRKNAYSIMGRLYRDHPELRAQILDLLEDLFKSDSEKVRQTAVYAAGEIGRTGERCGTEIDDVTGILEIALADERHPVRNAVIGALKRMGEKNPEPTLYWLSGNSSYKHLVDELCWRNIKRLGITNDTNKRISRMLSRNKFVSFVYS